MQDSHHITLSGEVDAINSSLASKEELPDYTARRRESANHCASFWKLRKRKYRSSQPVEPVKIGVRRILGNPGQQFVKVTLSSRRELNAVSHAWLAARQTLAARACSLRAQPVRGPHSPQPESHQIQNRFRIKFLRNVRPIPHLH